MSKIIVKAKNLDEAITKALLELHTTSDRLDYTVLDNGSKGMFGIGARPCMIEVSLKEDKQEVSASEELEMIAAETEPSQKPEESRTEQKEEVKPVKKPDSDETAKAAAETFLKTVLSGMGMPVEISCKIQTVEKEKQLYISLAGEDMGILIGKRGQTLDSLQYLTSLVVNKGRDAHMRVKLDTENYRERREATLKNLAKNIAYKVKRTKKAVALEPMNPYERRIIHAALQNDKYVTTRSEGEEPYRYVVIMLKK